MLWAIDHGGVLGEQELSHRLADDARAAHDGGQPSAQADPVVVEDRHDPGRGAGHHGGAGRSGADRDSPDGSRRRPWRDRWCRARAPRRCPPGIGSWTRMPCTSRALVQLADQGESSEDSVDALGEEVIARLDARPRGTPASCAARTPGMPDRSPTSTTARVGVTPRRARSSAASAFTSARIRAATTLPSRIAAICPPRVPPAARHRGASRLAGARRARGAWGAVRGPPSAQNSPTTLPVLVEVDRLGGRLLRQPGHGQDVAGVGHHEAGTRRELGVADGHREVPGPPELLRVVGERVLGLGHADGQLARSPRLS